MKNFDFLYHLCLGSDWLKIQYEDGYYGSSKDKNDGFIHMSMAAQVKISAARYYPGNGNLILLKIDPQKIEGEIKWEPSSRGELYAHIYGHIPLAAIESSTALPLDEGGRHIFPSLVTND